MTDRTVRAFRPFALLASLFALALGSALPASAVEEGLQELRLPPLLVEQEIKAETGSELPPPSYPVQHVEQLPFHGAWHEFVNVTTGGLVFRMADIKLPGRMPIDFGRIYDSKISSSLPPPPPGGPAEARWDEDLGKNWILGYAAYLVAAGTGYNMATTDGDVVRWAFQGNGVWLPLNGTASKHMILETVGANLVETQTDGTRWIFTYAVANGTHYALTKIEDRSGNWIEMVYAGGRLIEIKNSDDSSITLHRENVYPAYFPVTRLTRVADDTGREVHFGYNQDGLLTSVTDVLGHAWTFAYGMNEKVIAATDPLGNVYLTTSYNAAHRVAAYEGQNGPWTFTYSGWRTLVDDAFGKRWEYEHAGAGITTEITEPEGGVHALTLDASKNPGGYVDPEGVAVSWTYNADHLPTSYTPAGVGTNSIVYAYDEDEHWVTSVTGLDDGVTTFVRDASGRVTEETKPDGGKWTATYDPATGDRLTLTLPLGNVPAGTGYDWSFVHDDFGQIVEATDPTGRVFEFEYTAAGELWRFRRPDHHDQGQLVQAEWVYTRDAAGKITGITDPLGQTWTRTYDAAGRLVTLEGPAGTTVEYGYDAKHRITTATVIDGETDPVTTYTHDDAGRLASKTLPNGSSWSYGYDDSSRLVSVTDPLERTWTYGRDLAGRVTDITHPGGQVVTLARDAAGRLATRTYPGGRVESFTYDLTTGRPTSAEASVDAGAWIGRLDWDYDPMGRPDSVKTTVTDGTGTHWRELQFAYDVNGNRSALVSLPIGETISYAYDELDRLTSTNSDLYDDWTVTYDALSGHRIGVSAGSSPERWKTWKYDTAGRMIEQKWEWPEQTDGYFIYTHDAEGRLTSIEDQWAGVFDVIEWNALGLPVRYDVLAGMEDSSTTIFEYDVAGRPTARTRTMGTETTEWVFDWDAAGRLVYARQDDDIRTYTWDDNPSDPAAALRVLRVPTDPQQIAVEVLYGFDGRVHELHKLELGSEPVLTARYRWAPLALPVAMEAFELASDGTSTTTRMVSEFGGYYGEVEPDFTDLALAAPISGIDHATMVLRGVGGAIVPDGAAPFGRGAWQGLRLPDGNGTTAIAELVTGLVRGRKEGGMAAADAARVEVRLGTLAEPSFAPVDLSDDWLNGTLLGGGGLVGGDAILVQEAGSAAASSDGPGAGASTTPSNTQGGCEHELCVVIPHYSCTCSGHPASLTDEHPPVYSCCYYDGSSSGVGWSCNYGFPIGFATPWLEPHRQAQFSEGGVSLINGAYVTSATDLSVFGGAAGEIAFTRTYHSLLERFSVLGHRWTHNWDEKIIVGSDPAHPSCGQVARWLSPDGSYTDFLFQQGGTIEYPPDSLHRIRPLGSPGGYEIRSAGGTVRTFTPHGNAFRLSEIRHGADVTDLGYDGNLLMTISANGAPRLEFMYEATTLEGTPLLTRVQNALDPSDRVDFTYDIGTVEEPGCYELTTVNLPPAVLEEGSTAQARRVHYTYYNMNENDCHTTSSGMHMLETTSVDQFDPLAELPDVEEQRVVTNVYWPATLPGLLKVRWQCLGNEIECDEEDDADLAYFYTPGFTATKTFVRDWRVDGEPVNRYEFGINGLEKLIEDQGELDRVTTYEYAEPGLVSLTVYPDGSAVSVDYASISGIMVPVTTRQVSADPSQPDRVVHRTYEDFMGRVRTITGPEAFPTGEVPAAFDPNAAGIKEYTQFFVYDFDEGAPETVAALCLEWSITDCPPTDPEYFQDFNNDPGDNLNWYGNPVKVYRWLPEDLSIGRGEHELETLTSCFGDGRPKRTTGPDGVATEYLYYNDPGSVSPAWDWRSGGSYDDAADPSTYDGPLALTRVVPTDTQHPPLETLYAWSPKNQQIAVEDPQGIRTEATFSASGEVLAEQICDPEVTSLLCHTENNVLRTARHTYDLRGRRIREQVFDGAVGEGELPLTESRTTYDDLGRTTSVTFDPETGATEPPHLDLVSKAFYDERGRVTKTVSPEGRVTCAEYDALNRVTSTRRSAQLDDGTADCGSHGDDLVTTTHYDAMDRPVVRTDGLGGNTWFWYDGHGLPTYVSDGRPAPVGAEFDPVFLTGTAPAAPETGLWYAETTYGLNGQPIRQRFHGRQDASDDEAPTGFLQVSWRVHDELGRPLEGAVAIAEGFVPATPANSLEPSGPAAHSFVSYDMAGRTSKTVGAGGRITDFEYDGFGRQSRTLLPVYGVCTGSGATGEPCTMSGQCSLGTCAQTPRDTIEAHFDDRGRQYATTSTVHDPEGQARVTRGETVFDAWGRVVRSTGAPGTQNLITEVGYDPLGRTEWQIRRWSTTPPAVPALEDHDRAVRTVHDRAGRVLETRVRESAQAEPEEDTEAITSFTYDDDGLVLSMTDAAENTTDYVHDPRGLTATMLYPEADGKRQAVAYTYDLNGQPTVVQYRSDDDDQAVHAVTRTHVFDARGRLTSRTAALTGTLGGAPPFSGTTEQSFLLDDLGRVVKATDVSAGLPAAEATIEVVFSYDSAGHKLEENQRLPLGGVLQDHLVESVYADDGFRTKLWFPEAADEAGAPLTRYSLAFQPDARGRIEWILGPEGPTAPLAPGSWDADRPLVRYRYSGGQVWSRWHGNGTELQFHEDGDPGDKPPLHDSLGRVTGMRTVGPSPAVLPEFRFGFDRVGNLAFEQRRHEAYLDPAGTWQTRAITTDLMGRLKRWAEGPLGANPIPATATDPAGLVADPADAESWTLDRVGNWTSKATTALGTTTTASFSPNALNQYTELDPTPGLPGSGDEEAFGSDWLGQLRVSGPRDQQYDWDLFGRLTQVLNEDGSAVIAQYRYDAFNRRVERQVLSEAPVSDATTRFIYDGWRAIEERGVLSDPTREIVRARYGFGIGLDEVLWMDRDVARLGGEPDPVGGSPDDVIESRFFVHQDLRGSAVALSDDAAEVEDVAVVERYTYSAYGEATAGDGQGISQVGFPYLYTGQRLDVESGLHYFKNRFHDPQSGRFLRRDLIGYADGSALYQYAGSNPSMASDPLGLYMGLYVATMAGSGKSHGPGRTMSGSGLPSNIGERYVRRGGDPTQSYLSIAGGIGGANGAGRGGPPDSGCVNRGVGSRSCADKAQAIRDKLNAPVFFAGELEAIEEAAGESGFGVFFTYEIEWLKTKMRNLSGKELVALGATPNPDLMQWELNGMRHELTETNERSREVVSANWGKIAKEAIQLSVFDWEDPLGGSYLLEAATLIPIGKFAKVGKVAARGIGRHVDDVLRPGGELLGKAGSSDAVRVVQGGAKEAEDTFLRLAEGGVDITPPGHKGMLVELPGGGYVGYRPVSTSGPPAIDINIPGVPVEKIHYVP